MNIDNQNKDNKFIFVVMYWHLIKINTLFISKGFRVIFRKTIAADLKIGSEN